MGQHAGTRSKTQKKIGLGVGQHAGIVGQHEQEWWVNMDRNLHRHDGQERTIASNNVLPQLVVR